MRARLIACAWGLLLAGALLPARGGYEELPEPGKWSLSTDGELISIAANEVPMRKVMEVINEVTPAEIDIDSLPDRNLTVRYRNIPLDELLAKLNVSFVLTFSRQDPTQEYELESAWVSHFDAQRTVSSGGRGGGGAAAGLAPSQVGDLPRALGYTNMAELTNDVGVVYRTPFPITMKVDGNLSEWPAELPWQQITHDMGVGVATNDENASLKFASAADKENLYMAFKITDDKKVLNQEEADDTENEDSLELQIGEEVVAIKRHHVWRLNADGEPVGSGRQFVTLNNETAAWIVDGADGWTVEVKMPISAVGLKAEDAAQVPLEVVLNDDDDGGARDTQLRWTYKTAGSTNTPSLVLKQVAP